MAKVDFEKWIREPGLPPVELDFKTPELLEAQQVALDYIKLGGASSPANYTDYNNWYSSLRVIFLE